MANKKLSELLIDPDFIEALFKSFGYVFVSASTLKLSLASAQNHAIWYALFSFSIFVLFITLAWAFSASKVLMPIFERVESQAGTALSSSFTGALKSKAGLVALAIILVFVLASWGLINLIVRYS